MGDRGRSPRWKWCNAMKVVPRDRQVHVLNNWSDQNGLSSTSLQLVALENRMTVLILIIPINSDNDRQRRRWVGKGCRMGGERWSRDKMLRRETQTIKGIPCRSWVDNYWWCHSHGVSCVTRQMYATIADAAARATPLTILGGLLAIGSCRCSSGSDGCMGVDQGEPRLRSWCWCGISIDKR
jgi:hypothetical protein